MKICLFPRLIEYEDINILEKKDSIQNSGWNFVVSELIKREESRAFIFFEQLDVPAYITAVQVKPSNQLP